MNTPSITKDKHCEMCNALSVGNELEMFGCGMCGWDPKRRVWGWDIKIPRPPDVTSPTTQQEMKEKKKQITAIIDRDAKDAKVDLDFITKEDPETLVVITTGKIKSLVDQAYLKGYKEGSGDLGSRTAAEYHGFQEKIDQAVERVTEQLRVAFMDLEGEYGAEEEYAEREWKHLLNHRRIELPINPPGDERSKV